MENIDWNKHYNSFKWAASKNRKHRNGLHHSIQGKLETLVQEYDLTEREILDDLFCNYWERGHCRKYNEAKGSLNNWIAHYVNRYLPISSPPDIVIALRRGIPNKKMQKKFIFLLFPFSRPLGPGSFRSEPSEDSFSRSCPFAELRWSTSTTSTEGN